MNDSDIYSSKRLLRREIKRRRSLFSNEELVAQSLPIIENIRLHPRVKAANTILLYHSMQGEVFTHDLVSQLAASGKTVLLPRVIDGEHMDLRLYSSLSDMTVGAYGILEPTGEVFPPERYPEIPVAIIPGVAFDSLGNRLGHGKGYYDRLLSAAPHIYKIGVCFPFQLVNIVPSEPTDIRMDEIISQ